MSLLKTVAACATTGALAAVGVAAAQAPPVTAPDVTTITVAAPVLIASPALSPADFPGVRTARLRRPLPPGYVAVGHRVTVTVGRRAAYPTFTVSCPRGKTLRTFASGGSIGVQIVGPSTIIRERAFDYVGKPRWAVLASYSTRGVSVGDTVSGTIYGLCR